MMRTPADILETGAAWITETELAALVARIAELEAEVASLRSRLRLETAVLPGRVRQSTAEAKLAEVQDSCEAHRVEHKAKVALAEAKLARVVEALEEVDGMLDGLPSGVDEEADFANCSPDDATAHLGGLIRQHLRAALAAVKEGK
jgi:hypothetical protein